MALARTRFRRRAGIEPIIGHLKSDHRLKRNFLKGFSGDQINVLLTSTLTSVKSLRKPCNMREELGLCFVVPS